VSGCMRLLKSSLEILPRRFQVITFSYDQILRHDKSTAEAIWSRKTSVSLNTWLGGKKAKQY
jgi:hypothetical protein